MRRVCRVAATGPVAREGTPSPTLEHMSDLPLPPDPERLHAIRDWLEQQQARNQVIGTYLQLLREHVDNALAGATPPAASQTYRIQAMRLPPGRSVMHRDGCWIRGGTPIDRRDALTAMTDPKIRPGLEMCDTCHPETDLKRHH